MATEEKSVIDSFNPLTGNGSAATDQAEMSPHSRERLPPVFVHSWKIVVPILFLDYLVVAMPRSLLPSILDKEYGVRAYTLLGMAETVKGLLTFVASPAIGALSDASGRKLLFLACIVGTASPSIVLAISPDLTVYLVTSALSGALAATFPLAFAYISDLVPRTQRAAAFGVTVGLSLGLAFLIGPLLGALIEHATGSAQAVFDACLWVTAANVALTIFGLRETASLRPKVREQLKCAALMRRASPFAPFGMLRKKPMALLFAVVVFFYLSLWGFIANSMLYAKRRFGLGSKEAAVLLSLFGAISTLAQSVGLALARKAGYTEPQIARRCICCATLALSVFGVAWEAWMLYPAMCMLGIAPGGFATVSSLASQVVPPAVVGEAQGLLASAKAATEGLGPLLTGLALHAFEASPLPGAPWLFAAASMCLSLFLCTFLETVITSRRIVDDEMSSGIESASESDDGTFTPSRAHQRLLAKSSSREANDAQEGERRDSKIKSHTDGIKTDAAASRATSLVASL